MQLKNLFIIILFFMLLASLSAVSAMSDENTTISANNESITEEIIRKSGNSNSFTDLNDLINNDDSSIINLDNDYVYDSNRDEGLCEGIVISKSLTVEGNGHSIDANHKPVRIFKITSGNVVLNNITFKNSMLQSPGNAVYAQSQVNITNCNFTGNWAYNQEGGAVNLAGGNSLVEYCSFTQNRAKTGGAITVNSNDNCIRYSYFKDNTKDYGGECEWGSDISISSGFTSHVVYNVLLDSRPLRQTSRNHCYNNWFGINFQPECESLSIKNYLKAQLNYSINGNNLNAKIDFTESDTGNIVTVPWNRPVTYSIFSDTKITTTLNTVSFNGVAANVVVNAFVDKERLTNSNGNSWYVNSSVATNGDGSQSSPFKALKRAINNAVAGDTIYMAPGIYKGNNNVALTISKSLNIERWGSAGEVIFDGQSSKNIFTLKSNVYISSISFKNGDGMVGSGVSMEADAIVMDCHFINNQASLWGGAVYINKCRGLVINSVFEDNSAQYGAGAIVTNTGNLDVVGSVFINNNGKKGGAINTYNTASNVNIHSSYFKDNHANYGGAVQFEGNGLVNECIFVNNTAYLGGAVLFNAPGHIFDSTFINNSASLGGGAVYIWGGNHNISGSTFINSTSVDGSAILAINANLVLNEDSFYNNSAYGYGAVYQYQGSLRVSGSEFIKNTAYYDGGALYIFKASVKIKDTLFKANTAGYGGGAIHNLLGTLEKNNVILMDNVTANMNGQVDASFFNSFIELGNYTMVVADTSAYTGALPTYYNLAEEGFDTPVKNQGSMGICWAYASLGAVETALKKATGITYDLSENNMKNLIARYSIYGHNRNTNRGAYVLDPVFYLASSLGPVLESDDLTDTLEFSPALGNEFLVSNIGIILRSRDNPLGNDEVKEAIIKYGGVTMSLNSTKYKGYNFYQDSSNDTDHAVLIVGWDDNYSGSNFASTCPGDGAWIIKNSWGANMGKKGYFYVSYYDTSAAWKELTYVIFNNTVRYDRVYQYDYFRHRFTSSGSDVSWYKNIYTGANDEAISAFSTYFANRTEWEAYVYVGDELRHTQRGYSPGAGYYTFNFDKTVPVRKGEKFTVALKVYSDVFPYVPKSMNSRPGDWEISYLSRDGVKWNDINANNHVACLKVFTQNIHASSITINPIVNVTYSSDVLIDIAVENRTRVGYVVEGKNGIVVSVDDFGANRIILSGLAAGNYTITITNSDGEYIGCASSSNFTVFKANSSVEITGISNGIYNTVPAFLSVIFSNKTRAGYVVYCNNQTISVGEFDDLSNAISLLDAGNYSIMITNDEGENYTPSNATAQFNVFKANSKVDADEIPDVTYGGLIEVNFNVSNRTSVGYVLYRGNLEILRLDDIKEDKIALSNLAAGNYTIVIANGESNNYYQSSVSRNFTVFKASSRVFIKDIPDASYGSHINVRYAVINATTVTCLVKAINNQSVVLNETVHDLNLITLPVLDVGEYIITVSNGENENYTASAFSLRFAVSSSVPLITVTAEDICYGSVLAVCVKSNVSGQYRVRVGNITKIATLNQEVLVLFDNLSAGSYDVIVEYVNTTNYGHAVKDGGIVRVFKANSSVEIIEVKNGIYNTLNVSLSVEFSNSTNLTYAIYKNTQKIHEGDYCDLKSALFGLHPGNYSIMITNNGDENHNPSNASAMFCISKAKSKILADESIDLNYDPIQIIDFDVLNLTVLSYTLKTSGGRTIIPETTIPTSRIIISNLSSGEYVITIFNGENDCYEGDVKSVSISIVKAVNDVSLMVENTTLPNDVVIRVKGNVSGIYTVGIGNLHVNVTVDGSGEGSSSIRLPRGNYTATITHMDNPNYITSADDVEFGVVKAINNIRVEVDSFTYPSGGMVRITADIAGEYTVDINGTMFKVVVLKDNSTAFELIRLNPGHWKADIASYYSDDYEGVAIGDEFDVWEGEIDELRVTVSNVTYPQKARAIVHASVDGNYTVSVNGKSHSLTVYNGTGVSEEFEILDSGDYEVTVASNVDYYASMKNMTTFKVFKAKDAFSFDDVDVDLTAQPYSINISCENPCEMSCHIYDAEGKLIFNSTFDGNGIFALPKLDDGNYSIVLSTLGDRNHEPVFREYAANVVNHITPTLEITSHVNAFNVEIRVKTQGEGKILLAYGGREYGQNISGGEVTFVLENLAPNQYVNAILFVGSGVWANASEMISVTVEKQNASITMADAKYSVVNGGEYVFKTNASNQEFSFTINGKTYLLRSDSEGVLRISLTKQMLQTAGVKTIRVRLLSDFYVPVSAGARITVGKEKCNFAVKKSFKFKNTKKTKKIRLTLKDSKGVVVKKVKVTLKLKGRNVKGKKIYTLKTNSKGFVTFKITSKKTRFVKKGKYSATIKFNGDLNYISATKKIKLVIG